MPPQTEPTIGDLLSLEHIDWAWYAGAWQDVLDHGNKTPVPDFSTTTSLSTIHGESFAPGTAARAAASARRRAGWRRIHQADRCRHTAARLLYKPQGDLNEHSGYADIQAGDKHIADVVAHLEKSLQWPHMLVIVTYDENGGLWDHVAPPKADR